jgi:hypothetical protein
MELADGMLFVKLVKPEGGLLWHNDRIGNKPEPALGCLGDFVVETVKGKIGNIGGEAVPIALCDPLL